MEEERTAAESLHASKAHAMLHLAEKIRAMEKDNRYAIKKSRLYFEKRLEFTKILEAQKATILCLEAEVRQKKNDYTTSLRNLERISERIHEERSTGSLESAVSSDQEDQKSDFKSSESLPGNPPPYAPTAPPPYEDKYIIDKDDDSIVLNMIKTEQEEEGEKRNSRSLGSGVILLAQQLIGNGNSTEKHNITPPRHGEEADISYHTRPVGLSDGSDNSEVSSLASFNIGDDDTVSKMLMSHSELIKDIELATDRVGHILKPNIKSVSNAHE